MNAMTNMKMGFLYEVEVFRPEPWVSRAIQRYPKSINTILDFLDPLEREIVHNIMPTEGMNHVLSAVFNAGAQNTTWYLGVFEGNYTPVLTDTMAAFATSATESTAYAETTRQIWQRAAPAAGAITNSANKAAFTMNATKTIYGAFLSSGSVKGGNTGVLASAARFTSAKSVDSGDILRVTASLTLSSS